MLKLVSESCPGHSLGLSKQALYHWIRSICSCRSLYQRPLIAVHTTALFTCVFADIGHIPDVHLLQKPQQPPVEVAADLAHHLTGISPGALASVRPGDLTDLGLRPGAT